MVLRNKKMLISWILVIIWAGFIYFMSNMDTNESNGKSISVINNIIEQSIETTNKLGITNKHPSEEKKNQVIDKLNYPIRKLAHASEYFILTLLLINALLSSGVKDKKLLLFSVAICFIYACTDEYHQTFVMGRTGQFSDVLIDTIGSLIGCFFYFIIYFIYNKNKFKKCKL